MGARAMAASIDELTVGSAKNATLTCGCRRWVLRHNDQDSACAVRIERPQFLELMRGQLSVPLGGVPEPDQTIVANPLMPLG